MQLCSPPALRQRPLQLLTAGRQVLLKAGGLPLQVAALLLQLGQQILHALAVGVLSHQLGQLHTQGGESMCTAKCLSGRQVQKGLQQVL